MNEFYVTEIEMEILKVFVKRKILTNQMIYEMLDELSDKLKNNQEN